jgi:exonuclease III
MSINIIQWNINGLVKKPNDIKIVNQIHNPTIIYLQETNLKDSYTPHIKNFNTYISNRTQCNHASGGVATLIWSEFPSFQIPIQTTIEVVAATIQLETKITICNVYIPNQKTFEASDIEQIIQQLLTPFLILGDFNSHSVHWGSDKTDGRGKQIEKILEIDTSPY